LRKSIAQCLRVFGRRQTDLAGELRGARTQVRPSQRGKGMGHITHMAELACQRQGALGQMGSRMAPRSRGGSEASTPAKAASRLRWGSGRSGSSLTSAPRLSRRAANAAGKPNRRPMRPANSSASGRVGQGLEKPLAPATSSTIAPWQQPVVEVRTLFQALQQRCRRGIGQIGQRRRTGRFAQVIKQRQQAAARSRPEVSTASIASSRQRWP
jgi:hypothetical protein